VRVAHLPGLRTPRVLTLAVVTAVAVAFADSSIVVLALPDLYGAFDTSIVGVSWVITSYNLVVMVGAFALVPFVGRADAGRLSRAGLLLFCAASLACTFAWSLEALVVARCVQGAGAAMLLAGTLALLSALAGSRERGLALWAAAGTFGAAVGPALGGVLTQLLDWRAIFAFQAPVALAALVAAFESHLHPRAGRGKARRLAANVALACLFGALVGALFLAVLLVIAGWGLSPIEGAVVVSALPVAALAARPLAAGLTLRRAATGGALLLAAGLVALALLPSASRVIAALALGFCGVGLGLAVPGLTGRAVQPDDGLVHDGTVTIGARHAGLVVALVLVAPLLAGSLEDGRRNATLGATKVALESDAPIRQKVPIALELRDFLETTAKGRVPDLEAPFDRRGAAEDDRLRRTRDALVESIAEALTRGFRSSFLLSALLALLALVPILLLGRRPSGEHA
jgi:predicted MFS family arabinose efflux permease